MQIQRRFWKIGCGLIAFCIALIMVELCTSLIRGYGFVGAISRLPPPDKQADDDLRPIGSYCEKWLSRIPFGRDGIWPSPENVVEHVQTVRLVTEQPYKESNIWVLASSRGSGKYLYSTLPDFFPTKGRVGNLGLDGNPNYLGIVILCSLARWEGPDGEYHPYKKYPLFVRNHIEAELGGERWLCYVSLTGFMRARSQLPPVPGAVLFTEGISTDRSIRCRYPQELLPAVKKIYPNLEVPKEAILE